MQRIVMASNNRGKARRRLRALLADRGFELVAPGRSRHRRRRGNRRHLRGERPAQGAHASQTASLPAPADSRPVRGRAGQTCRAAIRRATPARTATMRPTSRGCSRPCATCPAPIATPTSTAASCCAPRCRSRSAHRPGPLARLRTDRPRGSGGFGYDPVFPRSATLGLSARNWMQRRRTGSATAARCFRAAAELLD